MPKLSLDMPHGLGADEAVQRLKKKFAAARAEHHGRLSDFREEWRDHNFSFSFRAMGMSVSGDVAVEAERVHLTAHLPLAAMFLKGAIEERLRHEFGGMLASGNSASDTEPHGTDRS